MGRSALIVVDAQNAFFDPRGSFARRGRALLRRRRTIQNICDAITRAVHANILTVCTRLAFRPDYSDAGLLITAIAPEIRVVQAYIDETWDAALITECTQIVDDRRIVLRKTGYDAFTGTALHELLQANDTDRLVICGALTNVCVESTVRAAFEHGYLVRVVAEATTTYDASLQEASLRTMATHFAELVDVTNMLGSVPSPEPEQR